MENGAGRGDRGEEQIDAGGIVAHCKRVLADPAAAGDAAAEIVSPGNAEYVAVGYLEAHAAKDWEARALIAREAVHAQEPSVQKRALLALAQIDPELATVCSCAATFAVNEAERCTRALAILESLAPELAAVRAKVLLSVPDDAVQGPALRTLFNTDPPAARAAAQRLPESAGTFARLQADAILAAPAPAGGPARRAAFPEPVALGAACLTAEAADQAEAAFRACEALPAAREDLLRCLLTAAAGSPERDVADWAERRLEERAVESILPGLLAAARERRRTDEQR